MTRPSLSNLPSLPSWEVMEAGLELRASYPKFNALLTHNLGRSAISTYAWGQSPYVAEAVSWTAAGSCLLVL